MIISEERNDVLPLQWSVNNWQKWKEVQAHVHNSISCLCVCRNILWRKTTNEWMNYLEGRRLENKKTGVNICHYSQIKYLGKVSIFWCFREEFLHFNGNFQVYLRILMKITNYLVNHMVYASLLGKSLFLAFGKGFVGFCKIFDLKI